MASEFIQLQQAQLAAILGPDPSPFESLITLSLSPSNDQRSHAESIFNFIKQNDQAATAQEALELLIELSETDPSFFKKQIVGVLDAMLQIAETDSLEEGTRHLAIEFVLTLAEARERAPVMIRKLPQFISRLFDILLKMLLDFDDEVVWHSAEVEYEDAGETSNCSVGKKCLDRLSIALGGNTIFPVTSEQLAAYLADPEWQKHHAALIAIVQIAKGCSKVQMS